MTKLMNKKKLLLVVAVVLIIAIAILSLYFSSQRNEYLRLVFFNGRSGEYYFKLNGNGILDCYRGGKAGSFKAEELETEPYFEYVYEKRTIRLSNSQLQQLLEIAKEQEESGHSHIVPDVGGTIALRYNGKTYVGTYNADDSAILTELVDKVIEICPLKIQMKTNLFLGSAWGKSN